MRLTETTVDRLTAPASEQRLACVPPVRAAVRYAITRALPEVAMTLGDPGLPAEPAAADVLRVVALDAAELVGDGIVFSLDAHTDITGWLDRAQLAAIEQDILELHREETV